MFFQQSHSARSAMDEAEENELGAYYLDPPPWMISSKKRFSAVSALSSRSRSVYGGESGAASRSPSVEESCHQPSRQASIDSRDHQRIYSRQVSVAARGSGAGLGRPSYGGSKPRGNPVCRRFKQVLHSSLGLFLVIQTYLCLGAFCFMGLEAAKEEEEMVRMAAQRTEVALGLVECAGNVSCHLVALKGWEESLLKFPQIYLEIGSGRVWSWIYSYYCGFTIISTIGYGNVTPLSVFGRLFAVVYAVVGIPLMLLFITDIGNKFARWVKIAIIKFRKWEYKIRKRYKGAKRQKTDVEARLEGDEKGEGERGGAAGEVSGEAAAHEVGGGSSPGSDGGYGVWNIPEVHVNVAMSTVDEEACEVETKDIGGPGGVFLHGFGKDQTVDNEGRLDAQKDNSDYGGSSTGIEGCIIGDAPDSVPARDDDDTPDASAKQAEQTAGDMQVVVEAGAAVEPSEDNGRGEAIPHQSVAGSDDSVRRPADVFVSVESETAGENRSVADADTPAPDKQRNMADEEYRADARSRTRHSSGDEGDICKNEASDALHTPSPTQRPVAGEMICDKCGQTMSNVEKPRTCREGGVVKFDVSEATGRQTESTSPARKHVLTSVDDQPFRNDQSTASLPLFAKHHERLSRTKSRSFDGLNKVREDVQRTEPIHQRPALRGSRPRRVSLPDGVSFQARPAKQNGRLPHRRPSEPAPRHSDGEEEGQFRERTATDSGVASSSSNSTDCSPKRRVNSLYPATALVDSSDDEDVHRGAGGDDDDDDDDVPSEEDDVMNSEEEQSLEKLRQLRFGAARPSLAPGSREGMRVSEADIAMLSIPLWLALLLLLLYLLIGAGCFAAMQSWTFLDGFYYCFISLSTIGFGDLVFLPQNVHAGLIFSFLYAFFGLCFTSMCMSLSSMELTLLTRKISTKFGVYRGRIRSIRGKRWASRRRKTIRLRPPDK